LNPSTQELVFNEAATYISDIMNEEFQKVYKFVINYPGLSKEEILMKYLEQWSQFLNSFLNIYLRSTTK